MRLIDEQAYKDGGAAFNKGKPLRSLFDDMIAKRIEAEKDPTGDYKRFQDLENQFNSSMLGFADALITRLRNR